MVDLWVMSARMCMQSFIELCCVLRKPWGSLFQQKEEQEQLEWLFGTHLRVQKLLDVAASNCV